MIKKNLLIKTFVRWMTAGVLRLLAKYVPKWFTKVLLPLLTSCSAVRWWSQWIKSRGWLEIHFIFQLNGGWDGGSSTTAKMLQVAKWFHYLMYFLMFSNWWSFKSDCLRYLWEQLLNLLLWLLWIWFIFGCAIKSSTVAIVVRWWICLCLPLNSILISIPSHACNGQQQRQIDPHFPPVGIKRKSNN